MEYKVILFDFHGVLCTDRFYSKTLLPEYREVADWIQLNVFGDSELVRSWMLGRIGSSEINRLIAEKTEIQYELLNELFEESIRKMQLDLALKKLAEQLKSTGIKIGIITDNMDVFSRITVANHQLDKLFDIIINSADYGLLKDDENGRLFDVALTLLGEDIGNSLMIDDSVSTIELFRKKGGRGYVYRDIAGLKSHLGIQL